MLSVWGQKDRRTSARLTNAERAQHILPAAEVLEQTAAQLDPSPSRAASVPHPGRAIQQERLQMDPHHSLTICPAHVLLQSLSRLAYIELQTRLDTEPLANYGESSLTWLNRRFHTSTTCHRFFGSLWPLIRPQLGRIQHWSIYEFQQRAQQASLPAQPKDLGRLGRTAKLWRFRLAHPKRPFRRSSRTGAYHLVLQLRQAGLLSELI